ncbi:hypothetical protein [Romboutsia sp. 1001713B170207_170306_H8]|nr:hypothetical protein [Romboutsia sp. 1001713B170207_170306_H8]
MNKFGSYVFYLILAGICYTSYTKYRQNRVSVSGLSIMIAMTLCIYFSKYHKSGIEIYTYITYLIGLCAGVILLLNLFNRNIFSQIYSDILNTNSSRNLQINTIIRKRKLENEFDFLTSTLILQLLVSIFIRFYSIINYGILGYNNGYSIEILSLITFSGIELYTIYKIILKTAVDKSISNKSSINGKNEGIVINLNKYKKVNK